MSTMGERESAAEQLIKAGWTKRCSVTEPRLSELIADLLPPVGKVLDVGCGDGKIAEQLMGRLPGLSFEGIDVLVRQGSAIPVAGFDGVHIPAAAGAYDVVMLIDVLHHAGEPMTLLKDVLRVAPKSIVIKDHLAQGIFAKPLLRLMDRVGNARYGVALPCRYWNRTEWDQIFHALSLSIAVWREELGLYPWPADLIFGRGLHFIAKLEQSSVEISGMP